VPEEAGAGAADEQTSQAKTRDGEPADGAGTAKRKSPRADVKKSNAAAHKRKRPLDCRPHAAQAFLKRPHFVRGNQVDPKANLRAIRWRVETYGSVPVEGTPTADSSAYSHAEGTRFFGLPIQVHEKIVEPLACVEKRIRATCTGKKAYTPRALGGFRSANSYRQGEVSNHLFGIAIDIDPERNPCCGCVDPWPTHPACKATEKSAFEKMAMPRCWVEAFERYGFYWLGRDRLEDTMHFEYLGDPDRGKRKPKPKAVADARKPVESEASRSRKKSEAASAKKPSAKAGTRTADAKRSAKRAETAAPAAAVSIAVRESPEAPPAAPVEPSDTAPAAADHSQ
jgi:hypothetical protein